MLKIKPSEPDSVENPGICPAFRDLADGKGLTSRASSIGFKVLIRPVAV